MKTITLCSGKGGVGKTVLAASLARIIQRDEKCNVLLMDLDVSVRGLTLLAFQNKYELDRFPFSVTDYLADSTDEASAFFDALQENLPVSGIETTERSLYQRLDRVFIIPSSTESERPDWTQLNRLELDQAVTKLGQLHAFISDTLDFGYLIFDTQAGLGSLSLAAATLSSLNLIVLEEDDISWRSSLNMFLEISELNKRLQRRSRNYFLANKVTPKLLDVAGKLRAFSFLPPVPYDSYVQTAFSNSTSSVLDSVFETTDFFRRVQSQVWREIAGILGVSLPSSRSAPSLSSWWRA